MKALSVFSGGLDSLLAAQIIRDQGIDVLAVFFETPFFTQERAKKSAHHINLPFKSIKITERHMEIVRNPPSGYGGNMNPCIDCHALMFKIAGELMEEEQASFIITGEVLGQRPMSQNHNSLRRVSRLSGIPDLILRPLSAKLLPKSIPEIENWVNRNLLFSFQGRSRKPQMDLAKQMNITDYPSPAGGCLLTEAVFSRRLKDSLISGVELSENHIKLLKIGRHFRISPTAKIVVGRNQLENELIVKLKTANDLILTAADFPGPAVLFSGIFNYEDIKTAATITASYSNTPSISYCNIQISNGSNYNSEVVSSKDVFHNMLI